MSSEEKRQALKAKIEAAESRNADRGIGNIAREATDTATNFVKEHPIASIAGVAAIGLAIGAMTKPGRNAGRQAGKKASALAAYASEIGMAYATGLLDAAGEAAATGKDKLEDFSDTIGDNAGALKRRATFTGGNAAAAAKALSRNAGKKAGRSARDIRSRIGK
ncbi:hypothetical protein GCM10023115_18230 [Pontixanthobacter gangjinensis]|uniref:DUF883 family protein n=1 Tax=Pontixanthobacter gangjinensis TaxID=1028742 RepID=A0A6I4SMF1_9SPHN|nr:hypothetical protein [Pontixanthobacter gangjinensis]MXO57071.1 hypothetical protein [Pontixanthobacter gangjinensis]